MSMKTLRPSEQAAIVGRIDPDANTAATYTTGWIDMASFAAIMAIIMAGELGTSATIDAKLEQATDGSGTGAKDIDGSDISQLTQAGTDQSDTQAVIQCFSEDLDLENGFTHARLSLTVGTATSDCAAVVLGFNPRYAPASDSDAATVEEIVTV